MPTEEPSLKTIDYADLRHDDDGYMLFDGQLFSGIALERWPNGQLQSETRFIDGAQDGRATLWYPNGIKKSEKTFVAGRVRGLKRLWHDNGVLKLEQQIGSNGVVLSEKAWDEFGRLLSHWDKA